MGKNSRGDKKRNCMMVCSCRFASSDEAWEVPEWFLDDERKHRKKPVPVTREMVEEYKQKWKEIDARPIKRVAEAKARKKRRVSVEQRADCMCLWQMTKKIYTPKYTRSYFKTKTLKPVQQCSDYFCKS